MVSIYLVRVRMSTICFLACCELLLRFIPFELSVRSIAFTMRLLTQNIVPVDNLQPVAPARGERHGLRTANIDIVMTAPDGRKLLQVEALRCTSYSRVS